MIEIFCISNEIHTISFFIHMKNLNVFKGKNCIEIKDLIHIAMDLIKIA